MWVAARFLLPSSLALVPSTDTRSWAVIPCHRHPPGVYDFDPTTATLSNKRVSFDNNTRRPKSLTDPVTTLVGPGFPDGMTMDTRGRLYVATFARSCIERFLPDGTPDLVINLPARCPTCPVWGGKDLTQLYVTTASKALNPGEKELLGDQGGDILRIDMTELLDGARGILKHEFVA